MRRNIAPNSTLHARHVPRSEGEYRDGPVALRRVLQIRVLQIRKDHRLRRAVRERAQGAAEFLVCRADGTPLSIDLAIHEH